MVEVPEVNHDAGAPMLYQQASYDPSGLNRLVSNRDDYGSLLDVGLMRAQTVQVRKIAALFVVIQSHFFCSDLELFWTRAVFR